MKIETTQEVFEGLHEPLISRAMFERVQQILKGKLNTRALCHDFAFRRLITCAGCGYSLIGETKKGFVYYRCHSRTCLGTCIREDAIEAAFSELLQSVALSEAELHYVDQYIRELRTRWTTEREQRMSGMTLKTSQLQERLARLTDAFLDGTIDRALFEERKEALLVERQRLRDELHEMENGRSYVDRLAEFLELAQTAYLSYREALPAEKRQLLARITSNRCVEQKKLILTLRIPFQQMADRFKTPCGGPSRDIPRTWSALLPALLESCKDIDSIAIKGVEYQST